MKRNGYTLVELIVTMTILAIIVAIIVGLVAIFLAVPMIWGEMETIKETVTMQEISVKEVNGELKVDFRAKEHLKDGWTFVATGQAAEALKAEAGKDGVKAELTYESYPRLDSRKEVSEVTVLPVGQVEKE